VVARVALIVLAGVLLGGCYASTEPATEVGPESAKLNAQGTAGSRAAHSYFEYWITGSTNRGHRTDTRDWPAGSSGPFSEKVAGLAASTSYSFRVCGWNEGDFRFPCAQTRTFKTATAVEDSVKGDWWAGSGFDGSIDARSGPSGQNPRGHISRFDGRNYSPSVFQGNVTCLAVNGNRAAAGAVGQESTDGTTWHPATMLATVVDNGASGSDTLGLVLQQGSTPPNCTSASFANQYQIDYFGIPNEFIVNDAP
jgi:hypothetical protein